jgi:hypothetical protein
LCCKTQNSESQVFIWNDCYFLKTEEERFICHIVTDLSEQQQGQLKLYPKSVINKWLQSKSKREICTEEISTLHNLCIKLISYSLKCFSILLFTYQCGVKCDEFSQNDEVMRTVQCLGLLGP